MSLGGGFGHSPYYRIRCVIEFVATPLGTCTRYTIIRCVIEEDIGGQISIVATHLGTCNTRIRADRVTLSAP